MPEEKKKTGVFDADIKRLMQLATKQSSSNIIGFGATLLAAKLQSLQQAKANQEETQRVLIEEPKTEPTIDLPPGTLIVNKYRMCSVLQPWTGDIPVGVIEEPGDDPDQWNKRNSEKQYCETCKVAPVRYPFGVMHDHTEFLIPITQEQAKMSFRDKIREFLGEEALQNYDRCNQPRQEEQQVSRKEVL